MANVDRDVYAKIWYSCWQDPDFLSMTCSERGFWIQLIVWAKGNGDSGVISFSGCPHCGHIVGTNPKNVDRMLTKFSNSVHWPTKRPKLKVKKTPYGPVEIEILNYKQFQELKVTERRPHKGKTTTTPRPDLPAIDTKISPEDIYNIYIKEQSISVSSYLALLWNRICVPGLREVKSVNEGRVTLVRQRTKVKPIKTAKDRKWWIKFFHTVNVSDFLHGKSNSKKHPNWKADFDFVLHPKQFVKIQEGAYDNDKKPGRPDDSEYGDLGTAKL
jgi:hypothetical protein